MARSKFALALTLAGTVLSSAAHALGLGAIESKSELNQPLEARIPLISADARELDGLSVSLASSEAFQRAGLDRPFHLAQLKFEVVRGDRPYVKVTTTQPVKEPFLGFLVEANWPRGRLVREFTLLLDPPVYAPGGQPQPVIASAPSAAAGAQASPAVAAQAPLPLAGVGRGEYTVSASDTLWQVARGLRPDSSVTINQMMVALLRTNPQAFIDGDMNRLRRGAVLRVPERGEVVATDAAAASAVVRQHVARWRQDQAVAADAPAPERGRLQVVAPEESAGERATSSVAESEAVSRLQRELVLSKESTASLRAENEDLKAQVAALREQILAMERAVNIETAQPLPGVVEVSAAQGEALAEADAGSADAEPATTEAAAVEQATVESAAVEPAPRVAPLPPPVPEPGFFDDARNQGLLAGVVIALLALVYLVIRRRRKPQHEEEALAVEAPAIAEPVVDEPVGVDLESAGVDPAAAGQDMPPENDALGEAEVYLAYGRYDQAKETVVTALEQSPARSDLRLKLLEILALTQDEQGFESHARTLREQVDAGDPAWQRAAELGREFLPGNQLFEGEAGAEAELDLGELDLAADFGTEAVVDQPAEELEDLEFDLDESPETAGGLSVGLSVGADEASEQAADPDFALDAATEPVEELNFALDEAPSQSAESEEPLSAEEALEFTVDGSAAEATSDAELEFSLHESDAQPPRESVEDAGLDFRIDGSDDDENVLEFALPEELEGGDSSLDELDEIGTKLDLARAYLDMGDSEGARDLLDEVLEEGNAGQKREAEDLLRQIA